MDSDQLHSLSDRIAALPAEMRAAFLAALPPEVLAAARYDWPFWARADQLEPPGPWRIWLMRSGRGAGKTRAGAEWVRAKAEGGLYGRVHLVGRTEGDARDTMVEGPSGLLAVSPPGFYPEYRPRLRRLTYPNGAAIFLFSAEEPDRLRGPQCEAAWCDEAASWKYEEAFQNLLFGLRLGSDPRCIVTSTPRPTRLLREIMAQETTVQTVSSTYANRTNLAPAFLDTILGRYEGTRLGRQEIHGELLEDVPGALWHHERLDELRVKQAPELAQVVVAVDPSVSDAEDADEAGIIVLGRTEGGEAYVLADLSGHLAPGEWARVVVEAFHRYEANWVVAEVNQGGAMVADMIKQVDRDVPIKPVRAKKGKYQRAEPAAGLYEQGRVHHVGCHAALEDQMCTFASDIDRRRESPDRVDALVWGLTQLLIKKREVLPAKNYHLGGGGHTQSLGGGYFLVR